MITESAESSTDMASSSEVRNRSIPQTKRIVSEKLRRAVDWKIFELTSLMVDRTVDGLDFEESIAWFQPKHAEDVVEERTTEGLCGYPLCSKDLPAYNPVTKQLKNANAKYRIDYKEKKIYEIEKSIYYCCVDCLEKCEIWMRQLDITLPYGRPVAKQLNLEEYTKGTIEDVLDLLDHNQPESGTVKRITEDSSKALPPRVSTSNDPPLYSHPQIDEHGGVRNVDFIAGKPVILSGKETPFPPPAPQRSTAAPNKPNENQQRPSTTAVNTTENEKPSQLPKPVIPKKIQSIKAAQDHITRGKGLAAEDSNTIVNKIIDQDHRKKEVQEDQTMDEDEPLPPRAQFSQSPVKKTEVSITIEEIMKTMKELQVKHGFRDASILSTTATTATPSSSAIHTSHKSRKEPDHSRQEDLWQRTLSTAEAEQEGPALTLSPANPSTTTATATVQSPLKAMAQAASPDSPLLPQELGGSEKSTGGVGGSRKKTIEWNVPEETKIAPPSSSGISQTLSSQSANNILLSSRNRTSTSQTTLTDSPVSAKLAPMASNKGRGGGPVLGLVVKEKLDAAPLSSNAILTKKEPEVTAVIGRTNLFGRKRLEKEEAEYFSQHIEGHYYQPSSLNKRQAIAVGSNEDYRMDAEEDMNGETIRFF